MQHSCSYIRLSPRRDNNVLSGEYPTDFHKGLAGMYLDPFTGADPHTVSWYIPVKTALLGDPVISEDKAFEVR